MSGLNKGNLPLRILYLNILWLTYFCTFLLVHSVQVKYKIFLSAIEYLPFSPDGDSKGSFEEVIERCFCIYLS